MKNLSIKINILSIVALCAVAFYFSSCNPDVCTQRAVNCQNSGVCHDGKCVCPAGYEGDSCQYQVNEKFEGRYGGSVLRSDGQDRNDSLIVVPSSTVKDQINFYYETQPSITYTAKVNNNDIIINAHKPTAVLPDSNGYTFYGTGSLNGNYLTLNLKYDSIAGGLKYNSGTSTFIGRR